MISPRKLIHSTYALLCVWRSFYGPVTNNSTFFSFQTIQIPILVYNLSHKMVAYMKTHPSKTDKIGNELLLMTQKHVRDQKIENVEKTFDALNAILKSTKQHSVFLGSYLKIINLLLDQKLKHQEYVQLTVKSLEVLSNQDLQLHDIQNYRENLIAIAEVYAKLAKGKDIMSENGLMGIKAVISTIKKYKESFDLREFNCVIPALIYNWEDHVEPLTLNERHKILKEICSDIDLRNFKAATVQILTFLMKEGPADTNMNWLERCADQYSNSPAETSTALSVFFFLNERTGKKFGSTLVQTLLHFVDTRILKIADGKVYKILLRHM